LNPVSIQGPYNNTWYFTNEEDFYVLAHDNLHWFSTNEEDFEGGEVCENDESVADVDGDTCSSYYDSNPDGCGNYDTEDFIAARDCCICGGGSTGNYTD